MWTVGPQRKQNQQMNTQEKRTIVQSETQLKKKVLQGGRAAPDGCKVGNGSQVLGEISVWSQIRGCCI